MGLIFMSIIYLQNLNHKNKNMENTDVLFENYKSKYNESVILTKQDKLSGVKIYSKEPYAQSLYNLYSGANVFKATNLTKDLDLDVIYTVTLRSYNADDRLVYAEEVSSKAALFIPLRELNTPPTSSFASDQTIEYLQDHISSGTEIKVMVYRKENNEIFASERKCAGIIHRQELEQHLKNNTVFNVKILDLIDGGYIALFNNSIKCFLPGSQAAANIITDFSRLLGQEIPVMIENYDNFNNLYIISYKKYIKNTLSTEVHKLKFGQKYTGNLTNKPLNFGVFVEWDNYFTGLIHQTDFENYPEIMNTMKTGDAIDFYVKDITLSKGETRVILTTNLKSVNTNKLAWQELKDLAEGKTLDYEVERDTNQIEVFLPDNTSTMISVDLKKVNHLIKKSTQVNIYKIDTIKQFVKFDFVIS